MKVKEKEPLNASKISSQASMYFDSPGMYGMLYVFAVSPFARSRIVAL